MKKQIKNFGFKKPFPVETTSRKLSNASFHMSKYVKEAKRDFENQTKRLKLC